jgi:3-hydroxyacyl-[acyl-carrier-protein] dehydratase
MTSTEMEFLRPVFPGQGVRVCSEKVYFRFEKLKCKVVMYDSDQNVICKGVISGMLKTDKNG